MGTHKSRSSEIMERPFYFYCHSHAGGNLVIKDLLLDPHFRENEIIKDL